MGAVQAHAARAEVVHMSQDGHTATGNGDTLVTTDHDPQVRRVHGHKILIRRIAVEVRATGKAVARTVVGGTAIGIVIAGSGGKGLGRSGFSDQDQPKRQKIINGSRSPIGH